MRVLDIPLKQLVLGANIRIDYEDMPNLMNSIKANNLLQPIGVKELKENEYRIIWGHRRFKAFEKLGYKTIPSVVFTKEEDNLTEEDYIILQIAENYQRKGNYLHELGLVVLKLRKTMSVSEIAAKLSLPVSRIQNALVEAARIPNKWQQRIRVMGTDNKNKRGDIPISSASAIASLRGIKDSHKEKLFEHVSKNDASKEQISALGSLIKSGKDFKQAVTEINKYKSIDIKIFVDRVKWVEVLERYGSSAKDFLVDTINSKVPNLAIKDITK